MTSTAAHSRHSNKRHQQDDSALDMIKGAFNSQSALMLDYFASPVFIAGCLLAAYGAWATFSLQTFLAFHFHPDPLVMNNSPAHLLWHWLAFGWLFGGTAAMWASQQQSMQLRKGVALMLAGIFASWPVTRLVYANNLPYSITKYAANGASAADVLMALWLSAFVFSSVLAPRNPATME